LPIKAFVRNLTAQSTGAKEVESSRLDASQWFTIDEPDFILQPDQTRTVQGTIKPPTNASPGGHYATIFFQPLVPQEALSPSTAYVSARVGALAFLIVRGDIVQKASLEGGLRAPSMTRHGPVDFAFTVHNAGNVHLMPSGKLVVYDWHGKQVDTLTIPARIVLPDASKEYSLHWQPPSPLGKYHAMLSLSYSTERTGLSAGVSVWVVPWLELLVGTILLPAVLWFTVKTRRRWRRAWHALRGRYTHR